MRWRLGCWFVIAIPALLGAWSTYRQYAYARSWSDPQAVSDRLADFLPGFSCPGLRIARAHEPDGAYGGGSSLLVSQSCRSILQRRLQPLRDVAYRAENEFSRPGCTIQRDQELCFEGEEIYFGAIRPG